MLANRPTEANRPVEVYRADAGVAQQAVATTAIAMAIITALYLGREIFIPLAVAILFSFVLNPLVKLLRRIHVPRVPAVILVVGITFTLIFSIGIIMGRQVIQLADQLPQYQWTLREKIASIRSTTAGGGTIERASKVLSDLGAQLRGGPRAPTPAPGVAAEPTPPERVPVPVEIHSAAPDALQIVASMVGPVLAPLAMAGIVVVFVIFIMVQREDLRDRAIYLLGSGDLHRTTEALDDAGQRLSRFFLLQTTVNLSFGILMGIGLSIIGVPSAALWGILAGVLRFVPYIGALIGAMFPIAVAAAVDPGWSMALWTLLLFVLIEPLVGHVIEPWLYGQSTGLSPIAIVIAATFWTWLWGPVGLLLATPLTMCVVVLGRHVERMRFLFVMLGDEPAMSPEAGFYQRLLAHDVEELGEHMERAISDKSRAAGFDAVAMPALAMARRDASRGVLGAEAVAAMSTDLRDVLDELEDGTDVAPADEGVCDVLCVRARGPLDALAAELLVRCLRAEGITASSEPGKVEKPSLVCVVSLAGDVPQIVLRRLRRRYGDAQFMGCLWAAGDAAATPTRENFALTTTLQQAVAFCRDRSSTGQPVAAD